MIGSIKHFNRIKAENSNAARENSDYIPYRKSKLYDSSSLRFLHLELKGVYHYRNRWSCGVCEGELDLYDRTFMPKKKTGIFMIKSRSDISKFLDHPEDSFGGNQVANTISDQQLNQWGFTKNEKLKRLKTLLNDYCPLEIFLKLHCNIPGEDPKYLSNLILNTLVVKKLWVARYSAKTRWYRYEDKRV